MIQIILVIGFVFVLSVCWLIYYSKIHVFLKAISLSLMIVLSVVIFEFYHQMLGTPANFYPDKEYVYIHHDVRKTEHIVLWVKSKTDDLDRLYKFPYDREIAKKLQEAKKKKESGVDQIVKFKKGEFKSPGLQLDDWHGMPNRIPKN